MNNHPFGYILAVNKPVGISSYDVVRKTKVILNFKKVGHGGTLDPFAEGLLLILIGRGATRRMNLLLSHSKSYRAILKLGVATDTADCTGKTTRTAPVPEISEKQLWGIENKFSGEISQIPPQFSAKKVQGKPAYRLARQGQKVTLDPIQVTLEKLSLTVIKPDLMQVKVTCSSGTYIRVLGEDIAKELDTVGHLQTLVRTRIGDYHLNNAVQFDNLAIALQSVKERMALHREKVNLNE